MQYEVNKRSQFFDPLSVTDRRFIQFVIENEQLVRLQRDITLVLLTLGCMQLAMNHPRIEFVYE
jgi:hypothetical protein